MSNIGKKYSTGILRSAEMAAISCSKLIGAGDKEGADQLAVDAMRSALNEIDFNGRIVIGEGERDEAPMLYIGEKVGTGNGDEGRSRTPLWHCLWRLAPYPQTTSTATGFACV